jgi:hypothetical protein
MDNFFFSNRQALWTIFLFETQHGRGQFFVFKSPKTTHFLELYFPEIGRQKWLDFLAKNSSKTARSKNGSSSHL